MEKLKQLKGSKHKYDVDHLENVYETVDEKEYTERVLQRQDDDWIEDDGKRIFNFTNMVPALVDSINLFSKLHSSFFELEEPSTQLKSLGVTHKKLQ